MLAIMTSPRSKGLPKLIRRTNKLILAVVIQTTEIQVTDTNKFATVSYRKQIYSMIFH